MQFFKGPFYFYIKYDKCRGFSFQYFMGLISDTKKYEEYKDKESKGLEQKMDRKRSMSPDPEDGEDGDKSSNKRKKIGSTMHNKNKYDKVGDKKSERRKRRSESNDDSDSDSEKKRRRERSNSNSNDSYKLKRLKKSKKRKKYDCSSERSSKKRDDEKDQDLDHLVGSNIFQERIRSFYFQDKLYNFIYTDFIIKCIFTKYYISFLTLN